MDDRSRCSPSGDARQLPAVARSCGSATRARASRSSGSAPSATGNGYYLSGHENSNLRQLVEEVIPLATKRAGGIAWEYLFHFDGGSPPWTSGLSQGTALQVLARAWQRFKEPAFLKPPSRRSGSSSGRPPAACG